MTENRKPISENDVVYVADLANLELTPEERARMVKDLNSILDHIDRLNELDTANVEPMAQLSGTGPQPGHPGQRPAPLHAMREDQTGPSLPRDEVTKNAPESDGTFFKVPKVIER
ncbi:MAG: Asp-tRNA(Asn)/Glu-tRNA(Gln) amidotransferase subunit GatC [Terriglobales bacterium]